MSSVLEIGPVQADELDALDRVIGAAVMNAPGRMHEWITTLGLDNVRAVRIGGDIVAGAAMIPMGQWFGGVCVPAVGLSAVGVAPALRGSGVGSAMLRSILAEIYASGTPLSILYPATLAFYRRAGYERAGQRLTYELPLALIDVREPDGELVPVAAGVAEPFSQLYERQARRSAGLLDRTSWMWKRKLDQPDQHVFRYLVRHNNEFEGYVVLAQGRHREPLRVLDMCVLTAAAGRCLLTLFANYRSVVERVNWYGGPHDPFNHLLGEHMVGGLQPRVIVTQTLDWMLRIVDVTGALGARGYPPGITAELHLDVHDDLLPTNHGRFVLQVADGRGQAHPGGQGRLRLGIRELAALYTGHMAPAELCAAGAIEAINADLALAGAIFAGPRPWFSDMF